MFKRIDKITAIKKLTSPNSILVDIRDTPSYQEGHVDGAISLNQDNISKFIADTDKSTPIIIMCYHGNSSQSAAEYLNQQGFEDVYSVDGGYEGWIND